MTVFGRLGFVVGRGPPGNGRNFNCHVKRISDLAESTLVDLDYLTIEFGVGGNCVGHGGSFCACFDGGSGGFGDGLGLWDYIV